MNGTKTYYAGLAFIACCAGGWFAWHYVRGRWSRGRRDRVAEMTGVPPSWHPDWDPATGLDEWEQAELDGIAAAAEGRADAGLRGLGIEGEGP